MEHKPIELVGIGPAYDIPDSYKNPLDKEALVKLFAALQEAFEVAAEGGVGDANWGDNDEADMISGVISKIWKKYQDFADYEQRKQWSAAQSKVRQR